MFENKTPKILVICEESQAVTKAFRARGIEAWSCDLQFPSGGRADWHLRCDVRHLEVLGRSLEEFDTFICFPPCTHLAISGGQWFEEKKADGRQQEGIDFFLWCARLVESNRGAVENPVGIMSSKYRKPDQIIQPYHFGDEAQKPTCLWLHKLPKLVHIKEDDLFSKKTHVDRGEMVTTSTGRRGSKWNWYMPAKKNRGKLRSKTFPGIANAMAEQWGDFLLEK